MTRVIVQCPDCGEEFLVNHPGQKVGGCYVSLGFSNGAAMTKLQQAIEILSCAAQDLPFRDDLAMAARLLRRVESQIVAIADE